MMYEYIKILYSIKVAVKTNLEEIEQFFKIHQTKDIQIFQSDIYYCAYTYRHCNIGTRWFQREHSLREQCMKPDTIVPYTLK